MSKFKKGDRVWYLEYQSLGEYVPARVTSVFITVTSRRFHKPQTNTLYLIKTERMDAQHIDNRLGVDETLLLKRYSVISGFDR